MSANDTTHPFVKSPRTGACPLGGPAPRPCASCPYRRDVPSGIWSKREYDKLRGYDAETGAQPVRMFQCHQADRDSQTSRVCSGWAGCHDGEHLLGLRIAVISGHIDEATHLAITTYRSPVPLFASGSEAADHGMADLDHPGEAAVHLMAKISRARGDLID